ncbi:MAG: M15 family metallopeptidase [Actinomycetota bacterium]|nr:M15 family metallopeptidase [Actinomycetota bacterium]
MARRASSTWWITHYGKPCISQDHVRLEWYPGRNDIIHRGTEPLWKALGAVFLAYDYKVPTSYTGSYNCRQVTGGSSWSGHAWPLAMDVNAKTNPYIRTPTGRPIRWGVETDMPAAMIREAEQITASGIRAFDWGGRWRTIKDAMHFQVRVTLDEIAGGVEAPRGFYGDDTMAILSDEAQQFFEDTYRELLKLDPNTNETWGKVLIEDYRVPPGGKHSHDATTTIGESE